MRLLVGLGNPGPKYEATRHNFGFLLLKRFGQFLLESGEAKLMNLSVRQGLAKLELYKLNTGQELTLMWPLTYMNLSGKALAAFLAHEVDADFEASTDLLLIIDDLSLPLGKARFRKKGSPGGHNGLKSIQAHLGHSEYPRLKLGIGRPAEDDTVVDYVLRDFSDQEQPVVKEVLDFVAPKLKAWCEGCDLQELSQVVNGWSAPLLEAQSSEPPETAESSESCVHSE